MKRFLLILSIAGILFSCTKEEFPPENEGKVMVEADIGPAGATLEAEGISITVPPGAFSATQTVQIALDKEAPDAFGENGASPAFSITGIPSVYNGLLTLAIRYDGTLENESYIALGAFSEVMEIEQEVVSYALYEAKDSAGYLVARIPSPEEETEEGAIKGSGLKSTLGVVPLKHLARVIQSIEYVNGTFFYFLSPRQSVREKVVQLAGYMDEAMMEFLKIKMADQARMAGMMLLFGRPQVVVTNMVETEFYDYIVFLPELSPCKLKEDGSVPDRQYQRALKMKINVSRTAVEMASAEELKSYAYLWVYRLMYSLYFGDRMDWFAYASASWMSEKYTGISQYSAARFSVSGMSPFNGMEAGINSYTWGEAKKVIIGGSILFHEGTHAHGMYPFIKYLDKRYPDDAEMYTRIIKGILLSPSKTPMEGIINAIEEPEYLWWPGFFEKYMTRQLVDVPADNFLQKIEASNQINFKNETDTTWLSDAYYPDMSARLFKINFLFPEFQQEATSLNLKLGPSSLNMDYVTALAFGLKSNTLEYFDRGTNLTVPNLKSLKESGYSSIVVAVVNSASEPVAGYFSGISPPAYDTIHIELDTRLQTVPDFNYVSINSIIASSNLIDVDGNTNEVEFWYHQDPRKGELINHTFTATWDEPWCEGCEGRYSGTIVVEFDPEGFPEYITRYYIDETTEEDAFIHKRTIVGENLDLGGFHDPLVSVPNIKFWVSGTDVCNYVTSVEETYTSYDGVVLSHSVDGTVRCDQKSQIDMKLYFISE